MSDLKTRIEAVSDLISSHTLGVAWIRQNQDFRILSRQLDKKYVVLPFDLWEEVIKANKVDEDHFLTDVYDCEDFAMGFKFQCARDFHCNGVGWVIDTSSQHAYCALLTRDGNNNLTFKFLEPQNDRIVELGDRQYLGRKGTVTW